jgi:hypothetical protein
VEKSALAGGKKNFATTGGIICNGQWKNPPGLAEKSAMFGGNSRSGGKLQAMLCENFPGKFRRRQVVVLRHALSGQELSEILFAVYQFTFPWEASKCCHLPVWNFHSPLAVRDLLDLVHNVILIKCIFRSGNPRGSGFSVKGLLREQRGSVYEQQGTEVDRS